MEASCFERRVAVEVVVKEFQLCVGFKGKVLAYGLENRFFFFRFLEFGERDRVLS